MYRNMGRTDRAVRILLGIILLAYALVIPDTGWNWVGWIGVIPIITAIVGYCPAYPVLGIKTSF